MLFARPLPRRNVTEHSIPASSAACVLFRLSHFQHAARSKLCPETFEKSAFWPASCWCCCACRSAGSFCMKGCGSSRRRTRRSRGRPKDIWPTPEARSATNSAACWKTPMVSTSSITIKLWLVGRRGAAVSSRNMPTSPTSRLASTSFWTVPKNSRSRWMNFRPESTWRVLRSPRAIFSGTTPKRNGSKRTCICFRPSATH